MKLHDMLPYSSWILTPSIIKSKCTTLIRRRQVLWPTMDYFITKSCSFGLKNIGSTYQRKCEMKLNPNKCVFIVDLGKFLGFMVSQRGIEARLKKIKALIDTQPSGTIKKL